MPGRVSLAGSRARAPLAWQHALSSAIDKIAREAIRPIKGPVPLTAAAVIFLDEAELLACLASDYLDGAMAERWWWKALLGGHDPRSVLISSFLNAPESIPAALDLLSRMKRAERFAAVLTAEESRALLNEILATHALLELQDVVTEVEGRFAGFDLARPGSVPSAGSESRGISTPPPWRPWAPFAATLSSPSQALLLAVGLMIRRAPAVLRSRAFATQLRQWSTAQLNVGRGPTRVAAPADLVGVVAGATADPRDDHGLAEVRSEFLVPGPGMQEFTSRSLEQPPGDGLTPRHRRAAAPRQDTAPQSIEDTPNLAHPGPASSPIEAIAPLVTSLNSARQAADITYPPAQEYIETEIGGVFYLINVGIFLSLYGDFTTPDSPGISLPIWDFVSLVGRRLWGPRIESDPVWSLLVQLAGRNEDQPPGSDFDVPDTWRIPGEWLEVFSSDGPCRCRAYGGRLAVMHPLGFCVLDVAWTGDDASKQIESDLRAYLDLVQADLRMDVETTVAAPRSPLERWLDWLMPYVEARLGMALGLDDHRDACRVLVEHRARVLVTPMHVDVTFVLNTHPVRIRMAGLDRDPGWVPSAGRAIRFNYE